MVFTSSNIIGTSSINFVVKVAEPGFFAVNSYRGEPFLFAFAEGDATITGVSIGFVAAGVAGILGVCREAEIGLSIVEGIGVYMVNDAAREIRNLSS